MTLSLTLTLTPVEPLAALSTGESALWIKRDDLSHPLYGGNKPRKLARILADATERGAERLVTVGALGSHHVLACAVFGKLAGLRVEAAVLPQPRSPHALETARASLAQGAHLHPVQRYSEAKRLLDAWSAAGAYVVPAGGSSALGTLGIVDAAAELVHQVQSGAVPEPDLVIAPLGSGGTIAGLVAGFARHGLRSRVLAVCVTEPARLFERKAREQARALLPPALHASAEPRLLVDPRFLGAGYGHATAESDRALALGAEHGITLDTTYSSKAFAAALGVVARGQHANVLFWHTLSSAPLAPLLVGAPDEHELDAGLLALAM